MFATTRGTVRRNKLSDFVDVHRTGMIAMKLDEGDGIVDVQICTEKDDVLLTTAAGQCIRFAVTDVRVFKGRTSIGVRGITLAEGDRVISLSILRHFEPTPAERAAYLKRAMPVRRGEGEAEEAGPTPRRRQRRRSSFGRGALCRDEGGRAVHPDRLGARLRQAHVVLRVPHHRPRRQRHRRDGDLGTRRLGRKKTAR